MSEEFNSAELANGQAVGINGTINGYNADVETRMAHVLEDVGRWVEDRSGVLMGHIKAAVTDGKNTVTMNLTDLQEGVMFHGILRPCRKAEFSFMAAVLDVDKHQLEHKVLHSLEDSGINMELEEHHHHHEHGHDCKCGCHDHKHEHHDHDCGCGHHHHHDEEHHHKHGHDCECGHHHH